MLSNLAQQIVGGEVKEIIVKGSTLEISYKDAINRGGDRSPREPRLSVTGIEVQLSGRSISYHLCSPRTPAESGEGLPFSPLHAATAK